MRLGPRHVIRTKMREGRVVSFFKAGVRGKLEITLIKQKLKNFNFFQGIALNAFKSIWMAKIRCMTITLYLPLWWSPEFKAVYKWRVPTCLRNEHFTQWMSGGDRLTGSVVINRHHKSKIKYTWLADILCVTISPGPFYYISHTKEWCYNNLKPSAFTHGTTDNFKTVLDIRGVKKWGTVHVENMVTTTTTLNNIPIRFINYSDLYFHHEDLGSRWVPYAIFRCIPPHSTRHVVKK